MVGGTLQAPGRVRHTMNGPSFLGELDGRTSERVERLAALLESGGLPVVVTDRIRSVEWSKLVHASPTTALPALTGLYLHEIFVTPELAQLYVDLVREGFARRRGGRGRARRLGLPLPRPHGRDRRAGRGARGRRWPTVAGSSRRG